MNLIKGLFLCLPVVYSGIWYFRRVAEMEGIVSVGAYVVFFGLCILALVGAAYSRYFLIRVLLAGLMTASAVVTESYRAIMAEFFSYDAFVGLTEAAAFADDAIHQFDGPILMSLVLGISLFAGIILQPRGFWLENRIVGPSCVALPLVVIVVLSGVVYARGGAGSKGLPSSMVAVPYLVLRTVEYIEFSGGERGRVEIARTEAPSALDIVVLVDESIRGDYLDINGASGVVSGLSNRGDAVHNFGLAASATNCSAGTNVMLRFGGTRTNYREAMHTLPSIWAYAHTAGMRAVYLDAQRTGGRLQNYMYEEEKQEIDEFRQFGEIEVLYRDLRIADAIVELTNNDASELILVNKMGAHFPVADKFPDEYLLFQPVLPRGESIGISDTGDKSGFDGDWLSYRNSYRNTILWNVGEFFNIIFEGADVENSLFIYTGDHGQDFHEDGHPGMAFHCSTSPKPTEGLVPMVVVTRHPKWKGIASHWSQRNRNSTSHFNIFATLLRVMGYESEEVLDHYGPSLFETTRDPMTFIASFDRFGRDANWFKASVPQGQIRTGLTPEHLMSLDEEVAIDSEVFSDPSLAP